MYVCVYIYMYMCVYIYIYIVGKMPEVHVLHEEAQAILYTYIYI